MPSGNSDSSKTETLSWKIREATHFSRNFRFYLAIHMMWRLLTSIRQSVEYVAWCRGGVEVAGEDVSRPWFCNGSFNQRCGSVCCCWFSLITFGLFLVSTAGILNHSPFLSFDTRRSSNVDDFIAVESEVPSDWSCGWTLEAEYFWVNATGNW